MSAETVISVENLSKAYPVYNKPGDMLVELLTRKSRHNLFWALRDISFSVKEKQRIGIIGPNGSGKTTLLKIITGNLPPTSGTIKVNGKVSAMLSLATAINLEDTGLNNIRFNLIMNGCPTSEIERLTEEIIDFAELGPFIYAPVKTYSAGMNARLSFTIATAIKPEILVIDEVLGAGDGYFIGKATKRMIDLCNQGKALVFVSHAISSIRMLCDTAIWLDNGSIRNIGPVDYICTQYEEDYTKKRIETEREGNIARKQSRLFNIKTTDMLSADIYQVRLVPSERKAAFSDIHYIRNIRLLSAQTQPFEISLALQNSPSQEMTAWLDILDSEWGRIYTRGGIESRILTTQTGRSRGGHILLKRPANLNGLTTWPVQLVFETSSHTGHEQLDVEFLDYASATWHRANTLRREKLNREWEQVSTTFEIPLVEESQFQQMLKKVAEADKLLVEILDVVLVVEGKETYTVTERQPFEIRVCIRANYLVPRADVTLHIVRSDGVYVFWQSSGMEADNMVDILGEVSVSFIFNNNYFNAGEYVVNVTCANGWDMLNNYPHSEIFHSKLSALKFNVKKEFDVLYMDFGQINMRVPVVYQKNE